MADVGSAAQRLARFDFSTESHAAHERVVAWREEFGRTILRVNLAPHSPENFRASATAFRGSNFGLLRASTSAVHQSNSPELIASDDVTFGVIKNAHWGASQFGRSAELGPGDGVMLNNSEIGSISLPQDSQYVAFVISQSAIRPLLPDTDRMFVRRVPASNAALQMLMRYLEIVGEGLGHHHTRTRNRVHQPRDRSPGAHAWGDPRWRGARQGPRATSSTAACDQSRRDEDSRAARPFPPHDARAHGIAPRQIQRLFEQEGTTFTEFVLRERLSFAHRLLREPEHAARTISALAIEAGFGDLSYFNHSFRRQYGATPSEARAAANGL